MHYLLQFYTFFIFVCLVLSNSLADVIKNYFLITILVLAVYAEAIGGVAGNDPTYFYTSLLARAVFIPSAYLYFRNRINKTGWSTNDLVHLLAFGLLLVSGIVIYGLKPQTNASANYFEPGSVVHSILLLMIYTTALCYFLLLLQLFKHKARSWFEEESMKKTLMQNEHEKNNVAASNNTISLNEHQILRMDALVKDYLESNKPFLQHRYSLKDLSEGTNIPLHHLSAFINKHYGINFNDFINGFRVQYCKQKILNRECEQKKLEAIAQESGFSNRNTFTSAFKKVTGVNPSEFLKTTSMPGAIKPFDGGDLVEEPSGTPLRYKLVADQYS